MLPRAEGAVGCNAHSLPTFPTRPMLPQLIGPSAVMHANGTTGIYDSLAFAFPVTNTTTGDTRERLARSCAMPALPGARAAQCAHRPVLAALPLAALQSGWPASPFLQPTSPARFQPAEAAPLAGCGPSWAWLPRWCWPPRRPQRWCGGAAAGARRSRSRCCPWRASPPAMRTLRIRRRSGVPGLRVMVFPAP